MAESGLSIREINQRPENSKCADCLAANPQWASSTLGGFICIKCSGMHRALGTHITLVRSCTLDSWSSPQLKVMDSVGNDLLNEYWEKNLPPNFVRPSHANPSDMKRFIDHKYVEKRFIDPSCTAPHLKVSIPRSQKSNPYIVPTLTSKESIMAPKSMVKSVSSQPIKEDSDSALNEIIGSSKGKIRIRKTVSKEKSMSRSSSQTLEIHDTIPVKPIKSEIKDQVDDIDDFFAEKPKQVPKPTSVTFSKTKKNTKDIEAPKPKETQPIELDNEKDLIDDFFGTGNDEKQEEYQIKTLPPLPKPASTAVPKPKPVDDAPNPFASSKADTQPKPTKVPVSNNDVVAPNPFSSKNSSPPTMIVEETKEAILSNYEYQDDSNQDDIDDFFNNDAPVLPKPAKPKMESYSYIPPPKPVQQNNETEIIDVIKTSYEKTKEVFISGFSAVSEKVGDFFNKDKIQTTPQTAAKPTAVYEDTPQPLLKAQAPVNSNRTENVHRVHRVAKKIHRSHSSGDSKDSDNPSTKQIEKRQINSSQSPDDALVDILSSESGKKKHKR